MKRILVALGVFALMAVPLAASAQENAGAGRFEVGFFPGGGTFFTEGSTESEASFENYALGASFAFNPNRLFGVEGEVGGGLGYKQNITYNREAFTSLKAPSTLAYNGNVLYSPYGSNRAFVPYATGGMGGLTLWSRDELQTLFDVHQRQSFLTENVGGGLKWYSSKHWGVRGDYRFIIINGKSAADPFFGLNDNRYGHRFYGSLMLTY
jgi:hypothetical protein